ncbi:hypothetical protein POM88_012238 [Heracleum sosnowskyi]|uniref:Armadillo repeat-containing protein n=1 Tax=Heracleum sosnowskyi TaxID=360622 RepID=A0AAD8N2A4_9APIA|nr:hypothetical protein POM88_012238 [Heracleum sosnowskyi]
MDSDGAQIHISNGDDEQTQQNNQFMYGEDEETHGGGYDFDGGDNRRRDDITQHSEGHVDSSAGLRGTKSAFVAVAIYSFCDLLYNGTKTLALACQIYLDFSPDELELILRALMKLLKYENSHVLAYACSGISYLCDGKQKMVVEEQQLGTLIDRLIELINSESRVKTIAGLRALGSIVRWGSDSNIELIIERDILLSLECLLGEDDKYYVKNACWIISNITARNENHIKAVIDSGLIEPLVDVVESYDLLDVKREAARAISNAIYGLLYKEQMKTSGKRQS